jgi:hypothetical protein
LNPLKGLVLPVNKLLALLIAFSLILTGCSAPTQAPVTEIATETPQATPTETATIPVEPATIQDVIAYEMEGSFNFFWEQANTDVNSPGYGLVRDRYPGSEGIASMASLGYGLTAYLVGIEKGYITYDQAYERVDGTLDTLLAMDRTEGFYYHFVSMSTGKRAWESEVSNIDTSILLMGVLSVGQYFGGDIQAKAQQIYDDVNWPWFIDESRDMFYMAYRPDTGFEGHWDFYAEQLMMYVLAAGSDTHPIESSTYYAFTRDYAKYGDSQPFIHSWFGSMFTYEFSHAWIDFRDYTDRDGVNWFQNSVEAAKAQISFATNLDKKFETLGPDAWGLSACDGRDGYGGLYGAPPSGFDNKSHVNDDTIPPYAATAAILFAPEDAQRAMLNYYSIPQLRSQYGFVDSYNLTQSWYDSDVIGIDKGVTLLMLANYENDFVYSVLMQNANILNGLARLQIIKNQE